MNDNHCPSYRLDSHRPHINAQQADIVKLQERVKVLEAELASAFVLKENIKIEENIKVNLRRDESGYVWLTVDQGPTKANGILNLGRQSWPENCSFFGQILADVIGEGNGRDFWSNYEAKVIVADYVVRLKEAQAEVERLNENYAALKDEFNRGAALAQQHCPKAPLGHSVFEGIPLLAAEVVRLKVELDMLRLTFLECAHCKGAMLVSTEPPCCDNCTLDEEDVEDWEERVLWSKPDGEALQIKCEHVQRDNELLKELFVWADNWLSDEAKDQGARAVLQKVRAALAGQTGEQ